MSVTTQLSRHALYAINFGNTVMVVSKHVRSVMDLILPLSNPLTFFWRGLERVKLLFQSLLCDIRAQVTLLHLILREAKAHEGEHVMLVLKSDIVVLVSRPGHHLAIVK